MKNLARGLMVTLLVGVASIAAQASIKDDMLKRFKLADSNKDGLVSHQEMIATVHKKFSEFDKNNDGYLALTELPKHMPVSGVMKQRMEKRLKKMAERHRGSDNAEMREHIEEHFNKKRSRLIYVARLDCDGDERVSVEEFSDHKIKRFKMADQNGDGSVSVKELEEAAKHIQHKRYRKMKRKHG